MEVFKTFFLLTLMTLFFIWVGGMLGGTQGMVIAFIIAESVKVLAENEGKKHDEIRRRIEKRLARKLYKVIKREPMIVVSLIDV
jgi:predicted PurR-regulated permease PerM